MFVDLIKLLQNIKKRKKQKWEQKIQVNKTLKNWTNTLHGKPQSSILGPPLFNVFLCILFPFIVNADLESYADNTPSAMGTSELKVINEIKGAAEGLSFNCMKVFLMTEIFIWWIITTKRSQVHAVKNFW